MPSIPNPWDTDFKCLFQKHTICLYTSIQSSAILTQSILSCYYIRRCDNSGRKWLRFSNHNRHPISRPHGRAMGCLLLGFWDKIYRVMMSQHCIMWPLWCSVISTKSVAFDCNFIILILLWQYCNFFGAKKIYIYTKIIVFPLITDFFSFYNKKYQGTFQWVAQRDITIACIGVYVSLHSLDKVMFIYFSFQLWHNMNSISPFHKCKFY